MRRLAAVAGASVLACASLTASQVDAATPIKVTGYAEAGETTPHDVDANAAQLATVAVDGVNITAAGGLTPLDSTAKALLARAKKDRKRSEFLVGNFNGDLGDFDARRAEVAFGHAPALAKAVARQAKGLSGVTVDFESLQPQDAKGLTTFLQALRAALPKGTSLSVDVMATDTTAGYRAEGYDLPAITRTVDRVVLMAYDQHGPGWSDAGPVGGLPWVQQTLSALQRSVPARKIDLGIAAYGYAWPGGPDATSGPQYTDAEARAAAGGSAHWDATQQEETATLADGTVLWWSDGRSVAARLALARSRHLHGAAVWRLGGNDRL